MKKSNTLFTLAFFAILAFSSCEREQWGNAQKGPDDIDNRAEGQIGLSALKVSVDEQTATTVTRAGINTDNFIIRIYDMDKEGKMVQEWKYSEMPEIFTLKVSHYSITAMSHEVQPAEFEKPYYFSKQDFEITENTVTDLKELVCTLNNIKVRIAYDSELQKLLDEDSKVKVSVGEGRLEYAKDETRAGYFKSFIDVLPGEERIIKYSLKQNSGGDGDNGEIGKVDIQIDATCEVVEKDITIAPGEEEPLPEPNPEPSPEPSPGTKPAITGKDFDITQSITIPPGVSTDNPYPVIVKIAVPEGIRNLKIGITSSSTDFANAISDLGLTDFDLANPGALIGILQNLGLPYGDKVVGKTDIDFDISGFTGLLVGFPGTHRFNLKVTDDKGNTASAILALIVN